MSANKTFKFWILALFIAGSFTYCSVRVDDGLHLTLQDDWPEHCSRTARLSWADRSLHGWVCAAYERPLGEFTLHAEVPNDQGGSWVFWLESAQGVRQRLAIRSNHGCDGLDPRPFWTFHRQAEGVESEDPAPLVGVRFSSEFWATYLDSGAKYELRTESVKDCAKQPTLKPLVVTLVAVDQDLTVEVPMWFEPSGYNAYWQGLFPYWD